MANIVETLTGTVSRVTFHNPVSGWSVLRVDPFNQVGQETVTVHQTKVFAGATMEFHGSWVIDKKFGRQFKATTVIEKKPATTASIEKYLGSGLIKGVGPKTAKRIVRCFREQTLDVFENDITRLAEVPGIAKKKLQMIEHAWKEHSAIRDVMIFLQGHGISTLFAVRVYKEYGDNAIAIVTQDPYRLANDFYGIGFFSADKVALSIGLATDSQQRVIAAIKHVLAAARQQGHCYLTEQQIHDQVSELLEIDLDSCITQYLIVMNQENQLRVRDLLVNGSTQHCYYSKTLYYDEVTVVEQLQRSLCPIEIDNKRVSLWVNRYCEKHVPLSEQQKDAVCQVVGSSFSILTGGPGCGKTTTTKVIVKLFEAMHKKVILAAPTGRAAQRMAEVIGREAKTIHRLLEWRGGDFKKNEDAPLEADVLIIDECSMLDISLTASLLKAVPISCQVLFIGDPDQLPSVNAGNVLKDIIASNSFPCFHLNQVFRQAKSSKIIAYAHQINQGKTPPIESPFKQPDIWKTSDCLFIDSDEATQEQLGFISRTKRFFEWKTAELESLTSESPFDFKVHKPITSAYEKEFIVPNKFAHVDLVKLGSSSSDIADLKNVVKNIHPWSSLHYGLSAVETIVKLYTEWVPKYYGEDTEIQVLSPMTRGSLGTANLNKVIQNRANPESINKKQISIGERVYREGDRVIHRRNNYDLNVFNGDIGKIQCIDTESLTCVVSFYPDNREVIYQKEDIVELDLAYSVTIHRSQGSEFSVVIIPVLTQHFKMLYRNLIYTGLTRAKKLAVFTGTRRALSMGIRQQDTSLRQTALKELLQNI